jgi:hypothetical protein
MRGKIRATKKTAIYGVRLTTGEPPTKGGQMKAEAWPLQGDQCRRLYPKSCISVGAYWCRLAVVSRLSSRPLPGLFPGLFSGLFPGLFSGLFPGLFPGLFSGLFSGLFPGLFPGPLPGLFPGLPPRR